MESTMTKSEEKREDQTLSSFTLHIIEKENGKIGLVAIDDKTNYQVHEEYESATVAVLEGIVALNINRRLSTKL